MSDRVHCQPYPIFSLVHSEDDYPSTRPHNLCLYSYKSYPFSYWHWNNSICLGVKCDSSSKEASSPDLSSFAGLSMEGSSVAERSSPCLSLWRSPSKFSSLQLTPPSSRAGGSEGILVDSGLKRQTTALTNPATRFPGWITLYYALAKSGETGTSWQHDQGCPA